MKQSDIEQIVSALKPIFTTKEDLTKTERRLNQKIEQTREGIVKDVSDYLHDDLYPLLDSQEKRITSLEKKATIRTVSE